MKEYIYTVIREHLDGTQGKSPKKLHTFKELRVGGLYMHLGRGYPGMQRVLAAEEKELPDPSEEEWIESERGQAERRETAYGRYAENM